MGIAERLRYARWRTGLKGAQVKERTGIGESSLSEFENGRREPSLSQLQKLARAYRRSIAFFLDEAPVTEEAVFWRERPAGKESDIETRFLRLCAQYHNLELWSQDEVETALPMAEQRPEAFGYPAAEAMAKKVRSALELGDHPALSLLSVLEEDCAVKVFHLAFEPTGTAASAMSETFGAAVLLNSKDKRWRRNFDLAHELFHLVTWKVFRVGKTATAPHSCGHGREEKLATCFARNLLMPVDAVRKAVASKVRAGSLPLEAVFDMARRFDVSTESMLWQLYWTRTLGVDEEQTRRLIDRAREMAPSLEERRDTEPATWPERYRALAIRALRHGQISIGRFAEYLEISRQEAMRYVEREVTDDEEVPLAPA